MKRKIKTSTVLIIAFLAMMLFASFKVLNDMYRKDGIIDFFGGRENLFIEIDSLIGFKNVRLHGNSSENRVYIEKGNTYKIVTSKLWYENNAFKFMQSGDTLDIYVKNEETRIGYPSMVNFNIHMPSIKYAESSMGACHIHGFKEDSIVVKSYNEGMVWLDEDTIANFIASGQDKSRLGIFDKSIVDSAWITLKGECVFMSRGTQYSSVVKDFGPNVKTEINGIGADKFMD